MTMDQVLELKKKAENDIQVILDKFIDDVGATGTELFYLNLNNDENHKKLIINCMAVLDYVPQ